MGTHLSACQMIKSNSLTVFHSSSRTSDSLENYVGSWIVFTQTHCNKMTAHHKCRQVHSGCLDRIRYRSFVIWSHLNHSFELYSRLKQRCLKRTSERISYRIHEIFVYSYSHFLQMERTILYHNLPEIYCYKPVLLLISLQRPWSGGFSAGIIFLFVKIETKRGNIF